MINDYRKCFFCLAVHHINEICYQKNKALEENHRQGQIKQLLVLGFDEDQSAFLVDTFKTYDDKIQELLNKIEKLEDRLE